MSKILILKRINDSFEKKINSWLVEEGCELEDISFYNNKQNVNELKKRISSYEKVIIFDKMDLYYNLLFYKNVYLWLWNTVGIEKGFFKKLYLSAFLGNIYTFDMGDVSFYHLKYNTQFFKNQIINNDSTEYDLYFVGADKNRYVTLRTIANKCADNKLRFLFQMKQDDCKEYDDKSILIDRFVDYDEVLQNVRKSKCIVDLCKDNQQGMTFRAIEALFFDKKIVTNNANYKNLSYYSSEMIYVIEDEEMNGLRDFVKRPNIPYANEIKEEYSIKKWLSRFC